MLVVGFPTDPEVYEPSVICEPEQIEEPTPTEIPPETDAQKLLQRILNSPTFVWNSAWTTATQIYHLPIPDCCRSKCK